MYNTETKQQGEWVTVEGMEFLEVKGGAYIKEADVGDEWVEFDTQTVTILEDLIQKVKSGDEDTHFLLTNYGSEDTAQMVGYRMSDMIMLSSIEAMIHQFTRDNPIHTLMLMSVIKDVLGGGDDE